MPEEKAPETRIVAAPITLVKKTVTRLNFDGTPREGVIPGVSSDIDLNIETKRRPGALDGRDAIEAILTVSSKPLGEAPYYTVDAEVRGLYEMVGEGNISDERAERFVKLRGMEELYDFFRLLMTIITTDGHYGQMLLPTISVAQID